MLRSVFGTFSAPTRSACIHSDSVSLASSRPGQSSSPGWRELPVGETARLCAGRFPWMEATGSRESTWTKDIADCVLLRGRADSRCECAKGCVCADRSATVFKPLVSPCGCYLGYLVGGLTCYCYCFKPLVTWLLQVYLRRSFCRNQKEDSEMHSVSSISSDLLTTTTHRVPCAPRAPSVLEPANDEPTCSPDPPMSNRCAWHPRCNRRALRQVPSGRPAASWSGKKPQRSMRT